MTLEFQQLQSWAEMTTWNWTEYQSFVNWWRLFGKNYDSKAALDWAYLNIVRLLRADVGMIDRKQIGLVQGVGETAADLIGYSCLHEIKLVIMSLIANHIMMMIVAII